MSPVGGAQPLTDERLAEIKARTEAATEGPWYAEGSSDGDEWAVVQDDAGPGTVYICDDLAQPRAGEPGEADAEFIAHARADVPDLIAEVERLRGTGAAPDELREQLVEAEAEVSAAVPRVMDQATIFNVLGPKDSAAVLNACERALILARRALRAALTATKGPTDDQ